MAQICLLLLAAFCLALPSHADDRRVDSNQAANDAAAQAAQQAAAAAAKRAMAAQLEAKAKQDDQTCAS